MLENNEHIIEPGEENEEPEEYDRVMKRRKEDARPLKEQRFHIPWR